MNSIYLGLQIRIMIVLLFCMVSLPSFSQESPVEIHLYLFAMDEVEVRQILKDGVTRAELDALQKHIYPENRLLEDEEPVELAVGENNLEIPAEKVSTLTGGASQSTIVFFYDVIPAEGRDEIPSGLLKRNSYIINDKDEKILIRENSWEYQSVQGSYRYFDFRYANVLGHKAFVYELTAEIGDTPVTYTITIK